MNLVECKYVIGNQHLLATVKSLSCSLGFSVEERILILVSFTIHTCYCVNLQTQAGCCLPAQLSIVTVVNFLPQSRGHPSVCEAEHQFL